MLTLLPRGQDIPRDPQGARCPCMPLALLSPPDAEETPDYWNEGARRRLESALALQPLAQRAKNIILFMGDGESRRSQPRPTAPQQPRDMAGEKVGLVQVPSSPTGPRQCLGRAEKSLMPTPCPPYGSAMPAGMGLSTVSAARIYKGQLAGGSGEESVLAMETFPHMALAKVSGAALGASSQLAPAQNLSAPRLLPDLHH